MLWRPHFSAKVTSCHHCAPRLQKSIGYSPNMHCIFTRLSLHTPIHPSFLPRNSSKPFSYNCRVPITFLNTAAVVSGCMVAASQDRATKMCLLIHTNFAIDVSWLSYVKFNIALDDAYKSDASQRSLLACSLTFLKKSGRLPPRSALDPFSAWGAHTLEGG